MKESPPFPYSRCSIGALVRLLDHTCGASAIHRGIREELCRRLALAAKTKPEQPLLFTGAEWSAIKRGGVKTSLAKGQRCFAGMLMPPNQGKE